MKMFLIVVACLIFMIALVGLMVEAGKEKTDPQTGCVHFLDYTHYGKIKTKPGMDCSVNRVGDDTFEIDCCSLQTP